MNAPGTIDADGFRTYAVARSNGVVIYWSNLEKNYQVYWNGQFMSRSEWLMDAVKILRALGGEWS